MWACSVSIHLSMQNWINAYLIYFFIDLFYTCVIVVMVQRCRRRHTSCRVVKLLLIFQHPDVVSGALAVNDWLFSNSILMLQCTERLPPSHSLGQSQFTPLGPTPSFGVPLTGWWPLRTEPQGVVVEIFILEMFEII